MKIKNISCTQFAGALNRNVSFEDGINIILGNNESGKSTLVNLLSRTLFQNAKIDKRSDKEFKNLYFPTSLRNGAGQGDFADGQVTFESGGVTYTVSKEWGDDPKCLLETPDGKIKDKKKIDEILRDALKYGEGVYGDILFTSQRGSDASLQTLMNSAEATDSKREIAEAASQAFVESDGISIEAVGDAIEKKIKELEGSNWDYENGVPKKKTGGGRWSKGKGTVLDAYYELEDANEILRKIEGMEEEADRAAKEYTAKDNELKEQEQRYSEFNAAAGQIALQRDQKNKIKSLIAEHDRLAAVQIEWPQQEQQLKDALRLSDELKQREMLNKYELAKSVKEVVDDVEERLKNMPNPTAGEVKEVNNNIKKISTLENKLCGMNLAARIKMLSSNEVYVKTVRTGEIIDLSDGNTSITEAVTIEVPGVMEMTLSPADVDVQSVNNELAALNKQVCAVLEKYGADSAEQLGNMESEYAKALAELETAQRRIEFVLNGEEYDMLEASAKTASARSAEEIEAELVSLCRTEDAKQCITKNETLIKENEKNYGSIDAVEKRQDEIEKEIEEIQFLLDSAEEIQAEFADITDPKIYLEDFKEKLEQLRKERDDALTNKTDTQSRLQASRENTEGEPLEKVKAAEERFEQQKELLWHWKEIQQVYNRRKSELQNNPMQDIGERFTGYLELITGGQVSSEMPEPDKVSMSIYSGNRIVDFGKLSEGTKETVALAFRLAALEHLFPEGGGVAVLDDPFTDMDEYRTQQSCRLVQEFAKRHQVIFLTCRKEYADVLDGNLITL